LRFNVAAKVAAKIREKIRKFINVFGSEMVVWLDPETSSG
jgi:hypothetical protein